MSVIFEKLSDEPILIATYANPYKSVVDMKETNSKCAELLEGLDSPLYRIQDLRHISLNFPKMLQGMAAASKNVPGSIRDSQVRTVIISENDLIKFGAESVGQKQYGKLNVRVFPTLEEALSYAREE